MKADEIHDMLHKIRDELTEKYRDQPDEVFIRDLNLRASKFYEELGLEPAGSRFESKPLDISTLKAKS